MWRVWRMCWTLYAEPYDPERPVVCFDETSKQLLAEKRSPIPPQAGTTGAIRLRVPAQWHPKPVHAVRAPGGLEACGSDRTSYHGGTSLSRCGGWPMKLTQRPRRSGWCWTTSTPTNQLPSTKPSSPRRLGEYANAWSFTTLPSTVVGSTWQRSSSVSWPGESCAGVLPDEETLSGEIAALEAERNQAGATIDWRFSTVDARVKLHHLYTCQQLG